MNGVFIFPGLLIYSSFPCWKRTCIFAFSLTCSPFYRTVVPIARHLIFFLELGNKLIFTKSVLNYIPLKLGSGKWSQRRKLGYVLGNFYLMLQEKHVKIKLRMKEILFQAMSYVTRFWGHDFIVLASKDGYFL